jgi:hypothetical protein
MYHIAEFPFLPLKMLFTKCPQDGDHVQHSEHQPSMINGSQMCLYTLVLVLHHLLCFCPSHTTISSSPCVQSMIAERVVFWCAQSCYGPDSRAVMVVFCRTQLARSVSEPWRLVTTGALRESSWVSKHLHNSDALDSVSHCWSGQPP